MRVCVSIIFGDSSCRPAFCFSKTIFGEYFEFMTVSIILIRFICFRSDFDSFWSGENWPRNKYLKKKKIVMHCCAWRFVVCDDNLSALCKSDKMTWQRYIPKKKKKKTRTEQRNKFDINVPLNHIFVEWDTFKSDSLLKPIKMLRDADKIVHTWIYAAMTLDYVTHLMVLRFSGRPDRDTKRQRRISKHLIQPEEIA